MSRLLLLLSELPIRAAGRPAANMQLPASDPTGLLRNVGRKIQIILQSLLSNLIGVFNFVYLSPFSYKRESSQRRGKSPLKASERPFVVLSALNLVKSHHLDPNLVLLEPPKSALQ